MSEEKKIIASSYITVFYTDVQALTQQFCLYMNNRAERNGKKKEGADLEEGDLENYKGLLQTIRFYVNKCYISYKTIFPNLKVEVNPKIEETYRIINTNYDIPTEILETYVLALNSAIVNDVIKEILVSNADIVQQLYNGNTN